MSLEIINKYKIKAKKSLWQNFLVDEWILDSISSHYKINWEKIIEVWPWYWALTQKLVSNKPISLDLVELDTDMIDILKSRLDDDLDVSGVDFNINNIDVLQYSPTIRGYYLIANIPYYITSPILRHFLYDVKNKPKSMLILMQKDVWDKILKKNKEKTSVLSLFIEKKSIVKEVLYVDKTCFIPSPKVDSSVLSFDSINDYDFVDDKTFLDFIKLWFSEPRKKLIKNLSKWWYDKSKISDFLTKNWFDENVRAEDLQLPIWVKIIEQFKEA